jgi:hypothetical protein
VNNKEIVDLILDDIHLKLPSLKFALLRATNFGRTSIVQRLLRDPRTNPALLQNAALKAACKLGRMNIVKLLLRDPRVDASAGVVFALSNKYPKILEVLRKHPYDKKAANVKRYKMKKILKAMNLV